MWQAAVQNLQGRLIGLLPTATDWAVSAAVLVCAAVAALLLHAAILALIRRILGERRPFLRTVLGVTKDPTRLALLLVALGFALPLTPLAYDTQDSLTRLLALATICLLGWAATIALNI